MPYHSILGKTHDDAQDLKVHNETINEKGKLHKLVFENLPEGAIITDAKGYIIHVNHAFAELLETPAATLGGMHCTEALDNLQMHRAAEEGTQGILTTHLIKNRLLRILSLPVFSRSRVVAVYGRIISSGPFQEKINHKASGKKNPIPPLKKTLETAEKKAILKALSLCNGNKTEASKRLEIHRTQLYKKLKKHQIQLTPGSPLNSST